MTQRPHEDFTEKTQAPAVAGTAADKTGPSEKEVDEIMEKISRSGLSSLTEEEREILRRASRR